jgi:hypothetical protein
VVVSFISGGIKSLAGPSPNIRVSFVWLFAHRMESLHTCKEAGPCSLSLFLHQILPIYVMPVRNEVHVDVFFDAHIGKLKE